MRQWTETRPGALWDVCGRDAGYSAPLLRCLWVSFDGQIDGPFDCPNCKEISFHFEFARAAMDRSAETLELIHRLKYGREIHLARELGILACAAFADRRLAIARDEKWPLVPVPLHWGRQRDRQFNQAEEIARVVEKESGLPMVRSLKRVRRTLTQTRLSRKQRMENLKGAFAIRKTPFRAKATVDHLTDTPGVILVDDVFTTGSTVDECAKILRKAGARRVAFTATAAADDMEQNSSCCPTPPGGLAPQQ